MNALEREYTDQYARCWRLMREHPLGVPDSAGHVMNSTGYDFLLDVANLRRRDIEKLREGAAMRGNV